MEKSENTPDATGKLPADPPVHLSPGTGADSEPDKAGNGRAELPEDPESARKSGTEHLRTMPGSDEGAKSGSRQIRAESENQIIRNLDRIARAGRSAADREPAVNKTPSADRPTKSKPARRRNAGIGPFAAAIREVTSRIDGVSEETRLLIDTLSAQIAALTGELQSMRAGMTGNPDFQPSEHAPPLVTSEDTTQITTTLAEVAEVTARFAGDLRVAEESAELRFGEIRHGLENLQSRVKAVEEEKSGDLETIRQAMQEIAEHLATRQRAQASAKEAEEAQRAEAELRIDEIKRRNDAALTALRKTLSGISGGLDRLDNWCKDADARLQLLTAPDRDMAGYGDAIEGAAFTADGHGAYRDAVRYLDPARLRVPPGTGDEPQNGQASHQGPFSPAEGEDPAGPASLAGGADSWPVASPAQQTAESYCAPSASGNPLNGSHPQAPGVPGAWTGSFQIGRASCRERVYAPV